MELKLAIYPHPVLLKKTKRIEVIDDSIKDLAASMLELMGTEFGIGARSNTGW